MNKLKVWGLGLMAAMVNGAATVAGGVFGAFIATERIPWAVLGYAALFGGVLGGLSYIKKSPLHFNEED